jgi:hypothetical protein
VVAGQAVATTPALAPIVWFKRCALHGRRASPHYLPKA